MNQERAQDWEQIESLFFAALDRDPGDRASFLRSACAGQPELQREVEALLVSHLDDRELAVERLLGPTDGDAPSSQDEDPLIGTELGAFRVTQLIGHGGMGVVYLGERVDKQFQQRVAIKIVRQGHRGADYATRFVQERQILAQLVHPNIATLLDGGVAEDGRPFLVMEYVEGVSITEYCDAQRLGIRDRLELFREVCSAVRYAHTRLVVHRDLKPANILVRDDGHVILVDFGIAKLLDPEAHSAADPSITGPLDRVLTPEYAAPEQVRGEAITTATDVYALGVLLYELLTGRTPFLLNRATASEIERLVCNTEPPRPSTAVARAAQSGPSPEEISRCRGLQVQQLHRALRGELENIVLKALRKEPDRRYQSAQQFDEDIGRHLSGFPVLAQPDSLTYRLGKFIKRHRAVVTAAVLLLSFVLLFSIISVIQAVQIADERDRAEAERVKAERVVELFIRLFRTSDPIAGAEGEILRIDSFLDAGELEIDHLSDQPEVQARMWRVLADIRYARKSFARARDLYTKSLEYLRRQESVDPGESEPVESRLALLAKQIEGSQAAEPLLRQSLRRARDRFGTNHAEVAQAMLDLGGVVADETEARELLEGALAMLRELRPRNDIKIASAMNALGVFHIERGRFAEAIRNLEPAIQLLKTRYPDRHPHLLPVRHNLASSYSQIGNLTKASEVLAKLLEQRRIVYGNEAFPVAVTLELLGTVHARESKYAEAESAFRAAYPLFEKHLDRRHARVANACRNVARIVELQSNYGEALSLFDEALGIVADLGQEESVSGAYMLAQKGALLLAMGQQDRPARDTLEKAFGFVAAATPPAGSHRLADIRVWLGVALHVTGEHASAEAAFRKSLAFRRSTLPADHPKIAAAECGLGVALEAQGRSQEAAQLLRAGFPRLEEWGIANARLVKEARRARDRLEAPAK